MPAIVSLLLLSLLVGFLGRNRRGGFFVFFGASMLFTPLVTVLFLILAHPRQDS